MKLFCLLLVLSLLLMTNCQNSVKWDSDPTNLNPNTPGWIYGCDAYTLTIMSTYVCNACQLTYNDSDLALAGITWELELIKLYNGELRCSRKMLLSNGCSTKLYFIINILIK